MRETQHTIAQWADATFGTVDRDTSHVARAMREMAELAANLADVPVRPRIVELAANVVICLTRLAERFEVDVISEAQRQYETGGEDPVRAHVEATEWFARLYESVAVPTHPAADARGAMQTIVAWLSWMCRGFGADLGRAVDLVMAVNRRRGWRCDGHGHGYPLTPDETVALGSFADRTS